MTTYSVAEAKTGLEDLLDKAQVGERVLIERGDETLVELRPVRDASINDLLERIKAAREAGPTLPFSSVELLNRMYEDNGV